MSGCTQQSGTCEYCRSGCTFKPGWFLPGEAELAAEFLGMTLEDFFREYLAADVLADAGNYTFVLSPAVLGNPTGTEFPYKPVGTCVFYQDERCRIHPVKPAECRAMWCGARGDTSMHYEAGKSWASCQDQIAELLGREPQVQLPTFTDMLSMLTGKFWDRR